MISRLPRLVALVVPGLVAGASLLLATANPSPLRPATPPELELLTDALESTARDLHRWAYTESRVVRDEKGKIKTDVVIRHDPSQPYAEQWKAISISGRPPTPTEVQKYRRQGERAGKGGETSTGRHQKALGELMELRTAMVASETAEAIVFEVPLKKEGNTRFPPEKFQVLVRINKASGGLENIAVRLRSSFRSKIFVKVKSGEGTLVFEQVDPKYPPTVVSVNGDASASVLFVSIGGVLDLKRTELKHVKPFDERFEVQIGTLRAIDF